MRLKKKRAAEAIDSLDPTAVRAYEKYWRSIAPLDYEGRWRRWVFSFCSLQAGWKQNVGAYNLLMMIPWNSEQDIIDILEGAGCGLQNSRAASIWPFTVIHRAQMESLGMNRLAAHPDEVGWPSWAAYRNHLASEQLVKGAKEKAISFAQEMCFPEDCRVIAVDTHMRQLYGYPKGKTLTQAYYNEIEQHWVETCDIYGYSPVMARHAVWDKAHDEANTRYWSYVFEDEVLETAGAGK